jgi:hypothetical protein
MTERETELNPFQRLANEVLIDRPGAIGCDGDLDWDEYEEVFRA